MKKLLIKNMVCDRCVTVVRERLEELEISFANIELGKVTFDQSITPDQNAAIQKVLELEGFELLTGADAQAIEQVKQLILAHIYGRQVKPEGINFSDYLAKSIGTNYSNLSKLFSSTEGITIEKFIIHQKVERAKELLTYDQQSLSQIAFDLGYSSAAHLSRQFKSVTGLTPSTFKQMGGRGRKPLDRITK
ncbi:AraC family transcriptional regulator [Phaeodactylibacter luteus]|jgi:AraC-like DNA-binding protein|uniref:Helix-turn-helix transcriptional regulator n=1 Tax=Phaeodactylibacter luteus TaxID=1564516 RepID=A0A5C6RJE3_9BACT|nr:AraC family transcriptional regulator [Phaeodactylibacter luteus]TXB62317.1 helix-turn-helix transcriptional regulator [Phaeodactylibacter luteus]